MAIEDEDLMNEDDNMELHEDGNYSGDDDGEHDQQGDWSEDLQSDIEQDGEELEPSGETAHVLEMRQLDEKLRENLVGLTSTEFTVRLQATKGFRHMLKGDFGVQVLRQYVQASPGCIELLEAWKLGVETEGVVLIFSLVTEILKHPAGKDVADDLHRASGDKQSDELKLGMYVRLRLDKFARTIFRTKMKDVYSQITSHDRKRQNAALLLMAAIVRRGKALASEVAAGFDFTLKVLPKLGEQVQRKGKQKGSREDHRPVSFNRRGFIEFAMSFLEVSTPSLLRWVLQIRPLYATVLRGLGKDDEKTIVYVLMIMQEKVLSANSMMPPGLRSAVFGDAALEQLSVISADSSLGRAADIAHDTLMMLCTDPCHGLLPEFPQQWDISTPSATLQKGNPARLLRLLLRLRPAEVDNHRNLLLAILTDRSLLASAYLDKFPYSLEPRTSSAWFAAVSLLSDLIRATKVSPAFSKLASKGSYPPSLDSYVLQSRLKCILPRSFTRVVINRGLLHANMLVKHGSLRVLLEALSSLECLLNSVLAAVENVPENGPTADLPKESLLECLSSRHIVEVQGLSGINILRALSNFDPYKANTLSHTSVSSELFKKKWVSLKQEIQDEIRGLLPDPQVLLSLLSSLKSDLTESAQKNKKRENPSSLECDEADFKVKRKNQKSDSVDQGVQIFVGGTKAEERKDIAEGSVAFYMDQNSDDSDMNNDDLITVAQIWGTKDICSNFDVYKDKELTLYTMVLDVLALYQRTLPIALIECSFDAFKLLPEEPLLLSTFQQKSVLSLLLESTGGLRFSAPGCEGPGSGTGQLYKYLRPLLKLMLYSPKKYIRKDAHLLAYRAMLSTSAFDRNKGEVGVWFSFLPVYNSAQVLKESQEVHSPESLVGDMFGSLGSTVVSFLCDAVSTVGKNLYKYLDELHSLLSKHSSEEDLLPPDFSPLVICILEKCLRVVESSSKSLKLAQRTVIAIYVASAMNFLLQSQVNSRALAFIITTMLSQKFQKACQPDQASETFLCEWSPLRSLLLFAQNILSKDQVGSNLVLMDKQLLDKDSSSVSQSLSQVLAIIKNGDFVRTDGAAMALTSSIVCAMPEEILKNFPLLLNISHKIFDDDYSVLLALFYIHKELFGQVAEAWPDFFFVRSGACWAFFFSKARQL